MDTNVLGKLSFTFVSQPSTFGIGACGKYKDGIIYSVTGLIYSTDHSFPKLQRSFTSENGILRVLFMAKTEEETGLIGEIEGGLYICPEKPALNSKISFSVTQSFFDISKDIVSEIEKCSSNDTVSHNFDSYHEKIFNNSILYCDVKLKRNGIVHLSLPDKHPGNGYKDLPNHDEDLNLELATVFYNAVRDVFHTHKHHSKKSDNIVSVQKYNGNDDWKMKIQFSMIRKMISLHGNKDEDSQVEAQGIGAYLKTYNAVIIDNISEDYLRTDGSLIIPKVDNFDLSTSALERKFSLKRNRMMQNIFLFFAFCSVYVAVSQIIFSKNLEEEYLVPLTFGAFLIIPIYILLNTRKNWVLYIGAVKHITVLKMYRLFSLLSAAIFIAFLIRALIV